MTYFNPAEMIGKRVSWGTDGRDYMGIVLSVRGDTNIDVLEDSGEVHSLPANPLLIDSHQPTLPVHLTVGDVAVLEVALQAWRATGDQRLSPEGYEALEHKLHALGAFAFGLDTY